MTEHFVRNERIARFGRLNSREALGPGVDNQSIYNYVSYLLLSEMGPFEMNVQNKNGGARAIKKIYNT